MSKAGKAGNGGNGKPAAQPTKGPGGLPSKVHGAKSGGGRDSLPPRVGRTPPTTGGTN